MSLPVLGAFGPCATECGVVGVSLVTPLIGALPIPDMGTLHFAWDEETNLTSWVDVNGLPPELDAVWWATTSMYGIPLAPDVGNSCAGDAFGPQFSTDSPDQSGLDIAGESRPDYRYLRSVMVIETSPCIGGDGNPQAWVSEGPNSDGGTFANRVWTWTMEWSPEDCIGPKIITGHASFLGGEFYRAELRPDGTWSITGGPSGGIYDHRTAVNYNVLLGAMQDHCEASGIITTMLGVYQYTGRVPAWPPATPHNYFTQITITKSLYYGCGRLVLPEEGYPFAGMKEGAIARLATYDLSNLDKVYAFGGVPIIYPGVDGNNVQFRWQLQYVLFPNYWNDDGSLAMPRRWICRIEEFGNTEGDGREGRDWINVGMFSSIPTPPTDADWWAWDYGAAGSNCGYNPIVRHAREKVNGYYGWWDGLVLSKVRMREPADYCFIPYANIVGSAQTSWSNDDGTVWYWNTTIAPSCAPHSASGDLYLGPEDFFLSKDGDGNDVWIFGEVVIRRDCSPYSYFLPSWEEVLLPDKWGWPSCCASTEEGI